MFFFLSGHRASDERVCQLIQRYFMSDQDLPYNYSKHMLYVTKGDTCPIGIVIICPQEYYYCIASKLFQTQSVCTKTDFSIFISYFRIFLKPRRKRQLDLDFPHVPVPCMPWICLSSLEAAEGVLQNCWRSNRLSLALATDSE